jgi:hypothetical protein
MMNCSLDDGEVSAKEIFISVGLKIGSLQYSLGLTASKMEIFLAF